MDTYGYKAIIEFDETLLGHLFDGQLFEPARVGRPNVDGSPSGGADYRALPLLGGATLHLQYGGVELALPARPSQTIGIRILLSGVGVEPSDGSPIVALPNLLAITIPQVLLSGIHAADTGLPQLAVDFRSVKTADPESPDNADPDSDVVFEYEFLPGSPATAVPSAQLAKMLKISEADAKFARDAIAVGVTQLGVLAFDFDVSSFGGTSFDPVAFSDRRGGALQLRVFAEARGDITAGGTSLRHADQQYAIAIAPDRLEATIAASIEALFPSTQATFGVTVAAAPVTFADPMLGTLALQGGQAHLAFVADVLTKHTSGHIHNYTKGTKTHFSIPHEHRAADLAIAAEVGDVVGLTIDQIGLPGGGTTSSYKRPSATLAANGLSFTANTTTYTGNAGLDGKVSFRVAFAADPTVKWGVTTKFADVHVTGLIYDLGFLLTSLAGASPENTTNFGIVLVEGLDPMAKSSLGSLGDMLKQPFQDIDVPSELALFLDELTVGTAGVFFGGRADAGLLDGAGRAAMGTGGGGIGIATPKGSIAASWQATEPKALTLSSVSAPIATSEPVDAFWWIGPSAASALPAPAYASYPVAKGAAAVVVAETSALVKILVERASLPDRLSWIVYPQRIAAAVVLHAAVHRTIERTVEIGPVTRTDASYAGTITAELARIFPVAAGHEPAYEQWSWNGTPLAGSLTASWGSIILDEAKRTITLKVSGETAPDQHHFGLQLTDVFGVTHTAAVLVLTPTRTVHATKPMPQPGPPRPGPGPLRDRLRLRLRLASPPRSALDELVR